MEALKLNSIVKAALAMGAAFAVVSCSMRELMEPEVSEETAAVSPVRRVIFHASPSDTKARFGTGEEGVYPTLWTSNDTEAKISLNFTGAVAADVTPSQDGMSSTLSAEIDFTGVNGPYTFYAVSPSSAAQSLSPSRESWKVTIPCEQTPTATSVDENAIILASASEEYSAATDVDEVDLHFEHLTAYGRVSLTNMDQIPSGATVQAVEMTSTVALVGDWFWACEASQGEHTLQDYGASYTITVNTSSTSNVWFACAPVDLSNEYMTVRVITNQGVLEKLICFDSDSTGKSYKMEAGSIAVFTVNMAQSEGAEWTEYSSGGSGSGSGNFVLVTDASTLAAGDEVLIVYQSASKALGPASSSIRSAVDVSISNNEISSVGTATVLTLSAGNSNGTWALHDGDGYLASQSSGNSITTVSSVNSNASWAISIVNGDATIEAQAGGSTLLQYNTSSPRFTCYKSTSKMKDASIFKRSGGGGGVSTDDPILLETEYGAYLGTNLTWTLTEGEDQVTRSYNGNILTYTLISSATVEELEISGYNKSKAKGDPAFPVTVNWRRGISNVLSNQVYNMAVVKESGPKVWLSDGEGHGCIIKK